MALTVDTALTEMFRKAIEERQLDIAVELVSSRGVDPDFQRGRYRGLAESLTLLEDCQKKLEER